MEKEVFKKKVNLLGATSVGKTSLIMRFVKNVYGEEYLKTIGSNVYKKEVEFGDGKVVLLLNDVMGEKTFNAVRQGAFAGSSGAIAVVDITRPETLKELINEWLPQYYELADKNNPVMVAFNKYDLLDKSEKKVELPKKAQKMKNLVYTSAKTGKNVDYIFKKLASEVAHNLQLGVEDAGDIIEMREIDSTRELLDAFLLLSSSMGNISYDEREEMLKKCGIDKFELEKRTIDDEDKVMCFAKRIIKKYYEDGEEYPVEVSKRILNKYIEGK